MDMTSIMQIVITAIFAYKGLKVWKHQLIVKKQFEAVCSLAEATYNLRQQFKIVRNNYLEDVEGAGKKNNCEWYAKEFNERWKPFSEALKSFQLHAYKAEVFWGESIRNKTDKVQKCAEELRQSTRFYLNNEKADGEDFKNDKEYGKKIRTTVFETGVSESEFDIKLNEAFDELECQLRSFSQKIFGTKYLAEQAKKTKSAAD